MLTTLSSKTNGEPSRNKIKFDFQNGLSANVKFRLILRVCLIFRWREYMNTRDNSWTFYTSFIDTLASSRCHHKNVSMSFLDLWCLLGKQPRPMTQQRILLSWSMKSLMLLITMLLQILYSKLYFYPIIMYQTLKLSFQHLTSVNTFQLLEQKLQELPIWSLSWTEG